MGGISVNLGVRELEILDASAGADGRAGRIRSLLSDDAQSPGAWKGDLPAVVGTAVKVSVRLPEDLAAAVERRRGVAEVGRYLRGVILASSSAPRLGPVRLVDAGPSEEPAIPTRRTTPEPPMSARPEAGAVMSLPRRAPYLLMQMQRNVADIEEGGVRVRFAPPATEAEVVQMSALLMTLSRRKLNTIAASHDVDKVRDMMPGDHVRFLVGAKWTYLRLQPTVGVDSCRLDDLLEDVLSEVMSIAEAEGFKIRVMLRLVPLEGAYAAEVTLNVR